MIHTTVENLKEYKDVRAFMCTCLTLQCDGENICSVSTGAWITFIYCFKYINDQGVDVYIIIKEIHDILDFPPFQSTNTTRKGVDVHRFIEDVTAVLSLEDLTAHVDKKTETREFFKTMVTAFHSPIFMVNIHCV